MCKVDRRLKTPHPESTKSPPDGSSLAYTFKFKKCALAGLAQPMRDLTARN